MSPGKKIKKTAVVLVSIFFSIFAGQLVFAQEMQGAPVLSLKEIDSLIEQTDYDTALKALSEYIRKYPDSLDSAQKRIDRIMKARDYYTKLANALIDVMETDPGNDQEKLAIIGELENLEKNPTEEHLAFIEQAKVASETSFFRSQFRRIMEEASERAKENKAPEAISVVKSGFYMYRDEFFSTNPASVTNGVSKNLEELDALIDRYNSVRMSWQNAYNAFIQAVRSRNYANAERTWQNFRTQMQNFAALRNEFIAKGAYFDSLFTRLNARSPELTENSYLSFMSHFTLGSASMEYSGILGALDAEWNYMTESAKSEIYSAIDGSLSDLIKASPPEKAAQKNFSLDNAVLQRADSFVSLALEVNNLYSLLRQKDGTPYADTHPLYVKSAGYVRSVIAGTEPSFRNYAAFKSMSAEWNELSSSKINPSDSGQNENFVERTHAAIASLEVMQKTALENLNAPWLASYKAEFQAQQEAAKASGKQKVSGYLSLKEQLLDWTKETGYYEQLNTLAYNESGQTVTSIWQNFTSYYASAAKQIQDSYEIRLAAASALADGISENTPAENNPANLPPGRYPQEASDEVLAIQKSITSDLALLDSMLKDFDRAPPGKNAAERRQVEDAARALQNYNTRAAGIDSAAQMEIRLAQSSRERGDDLYNSALNAYRRQQFERARSGIQEASRQYNESLSHQESAQLRADSDKKLAELGRLINEAENVLVVKEVRELKTRARDCYYAGNFEEAENVLNRAEARWAVTNVEEDEEIKNLKTVVQNALAMKTGREIKPTAPLYPEMSQILSNAHQYYDRGESLMNQGRREEAVELLNGAKQKLQELQMVYPLNQEASLLTLRIDRLIDPAQFNEMFARRVESARQNIKVPAAQQQAYSDLLDLAEIRPDYPGLRDLIYNAEIELGLRARPVDQKIIRQSNELTQEARRRYSSAAGNEEVIRQALALLDQAIALNPGNRTATELKDTIQTAVGGRASAVLSAADEAKYNRAVQLLSVNDILGAQELIRQLLQNPDNRRSPKIVELQERIQALQ